MLSSIWLTKPRSCKPSSLSIDPRTIRILVLFLELDLASLKSVRTAAAEFLSQEKELHILFNNA